MVFNTTTLDTLMSATIHLDSWLESLRSAGGYSGPVVHWWQNCLQFTGVALDWRCEGLMAGYLTLYHKSGEQRWLEKAQRIGQDLCAGQLPDGRFRHSQFELNPYHGGTPHEAACDIALLQLAMTLRNKNDSMWSDYLYIAERNLRKFYIARLWNDDLRVFCDDESRSSFVLNKAATVVEAIFLWSQLSGDEELVERYALPTIDAMLHLQITEGIELGAFPQYSMNGRVEAWYFPYYIARCIPALVQAHKWTGDTRYYHAAQIAWQFIERTGYQDGSFPQIVYKDGRVNRYPQWIAGSADIIRSGLLVDDKLSQSIEWLLSAQQPTGGFPTGHGFSVQASQRKPSSVPHFYDVLPVCGWNDKVLRLLAELLPQDIVLPESAPTTHYETECVLRNKTVHYKEDANGIEVRYKNSPIYQWHKGEVWANICDPRWIWK